MQASMNKAIRIKHVRVQDDEHGGLEIIASSGGVGRLGAREAAIQIARLWGFQVDRIEP